MAVPIKLLQAHSPCILGLIQAWGKREGYLALNVCGNAWSGLPRGRKKSIVSPE